MKERSNNIVVAIVEGETSTWQMELDLNDYLATGWRCSAHAIGPGVFVVRFPNPRVVAQIFYVGRIILKTSGVVINVSKWSSAVGSNGVMEVAWVKISNVPLDKRSERNLAYVASLVGIPLEIDTATLHHPASASVRIGCRNIDDIPSVAESVLGGHFCDFYFEVDQVLVKNPNREENNTNVVMSKDKKRLDDNDNDMSKKTKLDGSSSGLGEKFPSTTQIGEKQDQMQESQESMESDVSLHTSLLFDSMALDYIEEENNKMEKIHKKVVAAAKKRDIEGTTHIPNYFDALSNPEMILVAVKMGDHIPDDDFANIDVIREVDKFRNNNSKDEKVDIVENERGVG
ncbi:hypothetical protein D1007_53158 [Hordeum vulgare]|nr:hypothetical protein D1007_53158 [Hordeum vulgare]